jgi:peroxiredoxin
MLLRLSLTICLLIAAVFHPTTLAAQAGELVIQPGNPEPGEKTVAIYRGSGWDEPQLHLRARLRTPEHDHRPIGSTTIAVLARQPDGSYRGSFDVPRDVVYAALAVEDRLGERTDSRGGKAWDLVVAGPNGRPSLHGLEQQFQDHLYRDELALSRIARTMVELHPGRAESWNALRIVEQLADTWTDARAAAHRERVRAIDRRLSAMPNPDPEEIGQLFSYAAMLREKAVADRWHARLKAEHPGDFFVVVEPIRAVATKYPGDAVAQLRELESIWEKVTGRNARFWVIEMALPIARTAGDAAKILLWADRYVALDRDSRPAAARALAGTDATRDEGIRWLREELAALNPAADDKRQLGQPRAEFVREAERTRAALEADLGRALLGAGRAADGIAALERAAVVGWETARFRALGGARLSIGDTAGAVHAFALAASDPGIAPAAADSMRIALRLDVREWTQALGDARTQMLRRTFAQSGSQTLPALSLASAGGDAVSLESLLGDDATVVVFWSPNCPHSQRAMPRIVALAAQLRQLGVPVLAVTRDPRGEAETYLREKALAVTAFYDTQGEVARSMKMYATPQYFVLDGAGRVRFGFTSLEDVPRQVMALKAGSR